MLVAAAGAAGVVICLVALASAGFWYLSRPKPWNPTAILVIESPGITLAEDGQHVDPISFAENKADQDYEVDDSRRTRLLARTEEGSLSSPIRNNRISLQVPAFIPAKAKGTLTKEIGLQGLPRQEEGERDEQFRERLRKYSDEHVKEQTSIALFNETGHYQTSIPNLNRLSAAVYAPDGAVLFKNYCASCHEAADNSSAPSLDRLRQMSPEQILQALENGTMKAQAAERSRAQRRALAEYLSGKQFGSEPLNPIPKSAFCGSAVGSIRDSLAGSAWNGWGATITNTRFQPASAAGMTADDVPRLKLKWAFGFPGASSGGTQPAVVGGRVYVGDAEGDLFALDAETGCIHWTIEVEAGIRSAITIGMRGAGGLGAYFGDQAANVYAVDAESGKLLWKVKVDDYSRAAITGAPQMYAGRLYVPVSSREESQVGDPKYPCCAFRGSVVALDAATGKRIWKTYTIPEEAMPTQKNRAGTQLWGPSGAAVWNAPVIDVKRNLLYIGTGNNFSTPATGASDSIVALDMKSGRIKWVRQQTENDIWNASCRRPDREPAVCPEADAPDFDFGSSPALVELKSGRQMLIAGNKSGMIWALDPDQRGKVIWEHQAGKGSSGGGVLWGLAVDGENVYVPNGFFDQASPDASGGMAAFELSDGRAIWNTPNPPCGERKPCKPSHPAAITAIPGVVFSGTMDGQLLAYSAQTGKILWEFNTVRDYSTVNGVKANGGSISNAGPTVVGGMLFTNSGYSHHGGVIPGNVLLAFSAK